MGPTILHVTVVGALSTTGRTFVKTLAAAGYKVTVFTDVHTDAAKKAKAEFGTIGSIVEVYFEELESLCFALEGQDAIVMCGVPTANEQWDLIEAAVLAEVMRFVPAAFGGDISDPRDRTMQIHKDRAYIEDYLRKRGAGLSYTIICTGPLFDLCVSRGVLINARERSQLRFDDGEKRFSTTTVATAARAVAAALDLGQYSADRTYIVQDFSTTQNELLRMGKELTPGEAWTVTSADTADMGVKALEAFKEDPESRVGRDMQRAFSIFGRDARSEYGLEGNRELDIPTMGEDQIKSVLKTLL